jgi:hypothetical protein
MHTLCTQARAAQKLLASALTDRRMLFPFFNQLKAFFRVAMLRSQPVPQVFVS